MGAPLPRPGIIMGGIPLPRAAIGGIPRPLATADGMPPTGAPLPTAPLPAARGAATGGPLLALINSYVHTSLTSKLPFLI